MRTRGWCSATTALFEDLRPVPLDLRPGMSGANSWNCATACGLLSAVLWRISSVKVRSESGYVTELPDGRAILVTPSVAQRRDHLDSRGLTPEQELSRQLATTKRFPLIGHRQHSGLRSPPEHRGQPVNHLPRQPGLRETVLLPDAARADHRQVLAEDISTLKTSITSTIWIVRRSSLADRATAFMEFIGGVATATIGFWTATGSLRATPTTNRNS